MDPEQPLRAGGCALVPGYRSGLGRGRGSGLSGKAGWDFWGRQGGELLSRRDGGAVEDLGKFVSRASENCRWRSDPSASFSLFTAGWRGKGREVCGPAVSTMTVRRQIGRNRCLSMVSMSSLCSERARSGHGPHLRGRIVEGAPILWVRRARFLCTALSITSR